MSDLRTFRIVRDEDVSGVSGTTWGHIEEEDTQ